MRNDFEGTNLFRWAEWLASRIKSPCSSSDDRMHSLGAPVTMNDSCENLELFWASQNPKPSPPVRRPVAPRYRVGELLQPGRRRWPAACQYAYGTNGHELTLFVRNISNRLIHDIRQEDAEFALIAKSPVVLLAFRFGQAIPWSDAPFCVHMHPARGRMIPPPVTSAETRALLWVTLVNADDGIIHAQRGITLAPEFTRVLHEAIREHAILPFSPDQCLRAISDLLLDYPDSVSRLILAQARTVGNR